LKITLKNALFCHEGCLCDKTLLSIAISNKHDGQVSSGKLSGKAFLFFTFSQLCSDFKVLNLVLPQLGQFETGNIKRLDILASLS